MLQQRNTYAVNLQSLPQGVTELDLPVDKGFLERYECSEEIVGASVDAHVGITRVNDRWQLHFRVKGDMEVPCSYCLDPVTLPIDEKYKLNVEFGPERRDGETADADFLVLPYQSPLDLGEIVRDTLLLAIPDRCVHPKGECNPEMDEILGRYTVGDADEEEEEDLAEKD